MDDFFSVWSWVCFQHPSSAACMEGMEDNSYRVYKIMITVMKMVEYIHDSGSVPTSQQIFTDGPVAGFKWDQSWAPEIWGKSIKNIALICYFNPRYWALTAFFSATISSSSLGALIYPQTSGMFQKPYALFNTSIVQSCQPIQETLFPLARSNHRCSFNRRWWLEGPVNKVDQVWSMLVSMDSFTTVPKVSKARLSRAWCGCLF